MTDGEKFKDEDWDPHAYGAMDSLFVEGTWNSEFADEVKPSESDIILKNRVNFSAFRGTELKDIIESNGITCLFVMGFLSNVSVEETTIEAKESFPDLKIYVCSDGCAAKSKQVG
jgi:nicotinamidase-related amidase